MSERYCYAGELDTETRIRLTRYNERDLREKEIRVADASFDALIRPDQMNWLEVRGLTNADVITRIVKNFGFHELDAKDILTPLHVAKIEEYEGRMLIVLNTCYFDERQEMRSEHIGILVSERAVVTFTESDNPIFENTREALRSNTLNIRRKGYGLLVAFLLNSIIAGLADAAAKVEEFLEGMRRFARCPVYPPEFRARVFKISREEQGNRF